MALRLNQTSLYTFTDNPSDSLRYSADVEPAWDETYLTNHVQVNGGETLGRTGSGVAVDTASTSDYGVVVEIVDTQLVTGGDRQALAEYRLYRYAQPLMRLPEVPLLGMVNPASAWPAILDLEIGDAITVERFAGLTSPISLALNVEGLHYRGVQGQPLEASIRTSPRDTRAYFQIDHATFGKLDTGGYLGP